MTTGWFNLSKLELKALHAFAAPDIPIFFQPSVEDPHWPEKEQVAHITAFDGPTLLVFKTPAFYGRDLWVSRQILGMLQAATPARGGVSLTAREAEVAFEINPREGLPLLCGTFAPDLPHLGLQHVQQRASLLQLPETPSSSIQIQLKYLKRLELVRKAAGAAGVKMIASPKPNTPHQFLFPSPLHTRSRWHALIMPINL